MNGDPPPLKLGRDGSVNGELVRSGDESAVANLALTSYNVTMTIEQLKVAAANLSSESQRELIGFRLKLRNDRDPDYRRRLRERLDDADPSHWLTPDQFEARLKQS